MGIWHTLSEFLLNANSTPHYPFGPVILMSYRHVKAFLSHPLLVLPLLAILGLPGVAPLTAGRHAHTRLLRRLERLALRG
jgi:hypothetical protein